jgi:hypothetical protein
MVGPSLRKSSRLDPAKRRLKLLGKLVASQQASIRLLLAKDIKTLNVDDLANTINSYCITSLRGLTYTELITLFEIIAKEVTIRENKEIAILRLMQSFKSTDYVTFFNKLESSTCLLLNNLLKEMNDKSIYRWDKDNYTNFIGSLTKMMNLEKQTFRDKIDGIDATNTKVYGQILSLDPVSYSSNCTWYVFSVKSRFHKGAYNTASGKVTVSDVYSATTYTSTPYGPVSGTLESVQDITDLSPLTPVFIKSENNLPLVNTALEQSMLIADNVYMVPAIFLQYRADKIWVDKVETGAQLTFDAASILLSGGAALATKITWARRLWALAELADGVSSFAVNSGLIKEGDKIYPIVNIYNTTMGMIGIVDLATKTPKIARNLADYSAKLTADVKVALKNNTTIRNLILAQYTYYELAVKNLDNLTTAEQQLVLEGKASQISKLTDDQKVALDEQYNVWTLLKGSDVVNGAGNSLFGRNIINGINGFSDNVTTLASQQGINLATFKNIEELSVVDILQSPNLTKINSIRNNISMPDANTLMQKVIPKSDIQKYVSGQYKSCKGFMSTAKDSKHLITYDDIYYGMRLDYQGSAFSISDGSCGVIRFKAPNANTAIVPRSSNNVLAGVDDAPFPYTGHGFTSGTNGRLGVPEWKMNSFSGLQNGEAELYEVFSNGTEVLIARFDKQLGQFVPVK